MQGYPFEVNLPAAATITGVVLADQGKSIDWRTRRARRIGALPAAVVNEVLQKLEVLLRR